MAVCFAGLVMLFILNTHKIDKMIKVTKIHRNVAVTNCNFHIKGKTWPADCSSLGSACHQVPSQVEHIDVMIINNINIMIIIIIIIDTIYINIRRAHADPHPRKQLENRHGWRLTIQTDGYVKGSPIIFVIIIIIIIIINVIIIIIIIIDINNMIIKEGGLFCSNWCLKDEGDVLSRIDSPLQWPTHNQLALLRKLHRKHHHHCHALIRCSNGPVAHKQSICSTTIAINN